MSYDTAIDQFSDNGRLANPPGRDMARITQYNLNYGLMNLAKALQTQLADIEQKLSYLQHEVRQLKNR